MRKMLYVPASSDFIHLIRRFFVYSESYSFRVTYIIFCISKMMIIRIVLILILIQCDLLYVIFCISKMMIIRIVLILILIQCDLLYVIFCISKMMIIRIQYHNRRYHHRRKKFRYKRRRV